MRDRFAIVTYEVRRKRDQGGLGFGFLVETPDGRAWCFPSEETRKKVPDQIGAFEINIAQLKRQPEADDGRRCYVYVGGP